jgi:hypothetical protein
MTPSTLGLILAMTFGFAVIVPALGVAACEVHRELQSLGIDIRRIFDRLAKIEKHLADDVPADWALERDELDEP